MSDIKRFEQDENSYCLNELKDGSLVLYKDHLKTIEAKDKQIQLYREGIEGLIEWCDRYHGGDINGNDITERLDNLLSKDRTK